MRIAIVAPPWVPVPPPAYGGTEAVLDTLARGLVDAGHEVLLFATGDSTCPVERAWVYDEAVGVGVGGAAEELHQVIAAYDVVADADVVHDHTLTGPLYVERFPELPVVTTNHGPFTGVLGSLYRAVSTRVPVIAISHHHASTADGVELAGVVHHGIDLKRVPVGDGSGGYALFLGRMSPDKGVDTAVRVARRAGVPLRIAAKCAEPAELAYFRERVEPLLGGDIEYVGEVGGAEKLALVGEATCLLNPIAWPEPFGMVMIEALAAGTPVVTTPWGAAPELVADGVTGFVRADEAGLVAALGAAADLDRSACRAAAEERFSAERMVADHVAIYEAVRTQRAASRVARPQRVPAASMPTGAGSRPVPVTRLTGVEPVEADEPAPVVTLARGA
jgi:glycosyltransferase involved in cell wall biosynthesis